MLLKTIALPMLLVLSFALSAQCATSAQQAELSALGIDPSAAVQYLDSNGDAITIDEFMKAIAADRSYRMRTNPLEHTATLQLTVVVIPLKPGDAIPNFRLSSLHAEEVTNAALQGHFTLMSFFFSECASCIAEIQALNSYARKHKDVATMAVTYDDPKTAAAFASKWHFNWRILTDAQAFEDQIGVRTYPLIVLIGPEEKVRAAAIGSSLPQKGKELSAGDLERWVARNVQITSATAASN